jgi:hypothetical protein
VPKAVQDQVGEEGEHRSPIQTNLNKPDQLSQLPDGSTREELQQFIFNSLKSENLPLSPKEWHFEIRIDMRISSVVNL